MSQRRNVPPEYIAIVYEGLGERDHALEWFERAYKERSMNGWILPIRGWMRFDWIRDSRHHAAHGVAKLGPTN